MMDGEFEEFTIVNERSEIIGVLMNEGIFEKSSPQMQGIIHLEWNDTHFILNENTNNFFVPPPKVPESSSESGNDEDYYEIDNKIDEIQMDDIQVEIPLTNYYNDVKHVDDFGNDWEWLETDMGASSGPFTGQHGLMIKPTARTPQGFFNLFFDDSMWTLLSQQMNIYARQCIQSLRGIVI